jgi:hypothetical protein
MAIGVSRLTPPRSTTFTECKPGVTHSGPCGVLFLEVPRGADGPPCRHQFVHELLSKRFRNCRVGSTPTAPVDDEIRVTGRPRVSDVQSYARFRLNASATRRSRFSRPCACCWARRRPRLHRSAEQPLSRCGCRSALPPRMADDGLHMHSLPVLATGRWRQPCRAIHHSRRSSFSPTAASPRRDVCSQGWGRSKADPHAANATRAEVAMTRHIGC